MGFNMHARLALPYHGRNAAGVPQADVAFELILAEECPKHVGDERRIPIRKVAVLGVAGAVGAYPDHRVAETQVAAKLELKQFIIFWSSTYKR